MTTVSVRIQKSQAEEIERIASKKGIANPSSYVNYSLQPYKTKESKKP